MFTGARRGRYSAVPIVNRMNTFPLSLTVFQTRLGYRAGKVSEPVCPCGNDAQGQGIAILPHEEGEHLLCLCCAKVYRGTQESLPSAGDDEVVFGEEACEYLAPRALTEAVRDVLVRVVF